MLEERDKERLTRHLESLTGELKDFQKFAEYTWLDLQRIQLLLNLFNRLF